MIQYSHVNGKHPWPNDKKPRKEEYLFQISLPQSNKSNTRTFSFSKSTMIVPMFVDWADGSFGRATIDVTWNIPHIYMAIYILSGEKHK